MLNFFTDLADYSCFHLLGLEPGTKLTSSLHFFIEDTAKIFFLLIVMIYVIGFLRASLNMEKVRAYIINKPKGLGYLIAAVFGAITPFCSCSSIPLFLGFTSAGIPTGITLSFLITSPLINEVAIVLLGSILGWKFTAIYIVMGLAVGVAGGYLFTALKADLYLQPLGEAALKAQANNLSNGDIVQKKLSFKQRHLFAKAETTEIFIRIWKWVFIGVGAGAALHGYVPDTWISENLSANNILSVPVSVLMGIPLYSNATAIVPVISTLIAKGLPIGTALALMMSTVGASFPEFILLKQVLKPRLLIWLFLYFLASFTLIGWLTNFFF
jgi:uncharacterized membrane protein YraQ (UPF0718 family)